MARSDPATQGYVDESIADTLEELLPGLTRHGAREELKASLEPEGFLTVRIDQLVGARLTKLDEKLAELEEADARVARVLWGEADPISQKHRPGIVQITYDLDGQAKQLAASAKTLKALTMWLGGGTFTGVLGLGALLWKLTAG